MPLPGQGASLREPAVDGAESGEDGGIFDGAVPVERDHTGQEHKFAVESSFYRSGHIPAGKEVHHGDPFQAQLDARRCLLGGREGSAGGCPGAAGRAVHFPRLTLKRAGTLFQLDAAVHFVIGPLQLDCGHDQESTGRRMGDDGRSRLRMRLRLIRGGGLRRLAREVSGEWFERLEFSGQNKLLCASTHDQISASRLVAWRAAKMAASSGERLSVAMPVSERVCRPVTRRAATKT